MGFGLADHTGNLAQSLRHEPGLQTDMGIAHFAVDFGLGNQCGNLFDNDNIDGTASYQCFSDFKGLFACIGLGNDQVFNIYPKGFCIYGIQRMLGIDEGCFATSLLGFGDCMQRNGGLSGGLWTVYLDNTDPLAGPPTPRRYPAQRTVEIVSNFIMGSLAQLHDGTFSQTAFLLVNTISSAFFFSLHHSP